jgi:hypothetical protein
MGWMAGVQFPAQGGMLNDWCLILSTDSDENFPEKFKSENFSFSYKDS